MFNYFDNAVLQGNAYAKIRGGVLTWEPNNTQAQSEVQKLLECAEFMRDYCKAHREQEYIIGTNAHPRCTCPFAAANSARAMLKWCAAYGSPDEWAYWTKESTVNED